MSARVVDMQVPVGSVFSDRGVEPVEPLREIIMRNQQDPLRSAAAEGHVGRCGGFQKLAVPGFVDMPVTLALRVGVGARGGAEDGDGTIRRLPADPSLFDQRTPQVFLDSLGAGIVEIHRSESRSLTGLAPVLLAGILQGGAQN